MKAIILAAGVGNRLKPVTDKTPKCLININGKSVIERMLDSIVASGIKDIFIVIGHLASMIRNVVGKDYKGAKVNYIFNQRYELGSVVSLYLAEYPILQDNVIIMDADVVFEDEVLRRLAGSRCQNCLLMDKAFNDSGEEMKIAVLDKRVVQIARKITRPHDEAGEGIGFFKLSSVYRKEYGESLKRVIAVSRACDYENVLDDLVKYIPVGFEDITGLKWTEIDFEGDIEKARALNL